MILTIGLDYHVTLSISVPSDMYARSMLMFVDLMDEDLSLTVQVCRNLNGYIQIYSYLCLIFSFHAVATTTTATIN